MKKVLVILYYWPPAGGSAVQRWLKFCKYLPEYGWEPIVIAPENAHYTDLDPDLGQEIPENIQILKVPIREPHKLYKKFVGLNKDEEIGAYMTLKSEPKGLARIKNEISVWIRSNVFIPDARFLWVNPTFRFLKRYLKHNPVDAIITTGPPQSVHLIGLKLKSVLNIPWIADFRDPWTSTDLHTALKLSRYAEKKHLRLESKVIRSADLIIAIGNDMKDEFSRLGAKEIAVITNGYDDPDLPEEPVDPDNVFSIVHLGTLHATRNSNALWKILSEKAASDENFARELKINLIGTVDFKVIKEIEALGLGKNLSLAKFVRHQEGIEILRRSQVLLLLINKSNNAKGVITGKLFEYLAAARPVLLIGPVDGDAAGIVSETGCGLVAAFEDEEMIRKHIDHFFVLYQQNALNVQPGSIERFSRRSLTQRLSGELDRITALPVNQHAK